VPFNWLGLSDEDLTRPGRPPSGSLTLWRSTTSATATVVTLEVSLSPDEVEFVYDGQQDTEAGVLIGVLVDCADCGDLRNSVTEAIDYVFDYRMHDPAPPGTPGGAGSLC
jgi:hypothetical protein